MKPPLTSVYEFINSTKKEIRIWIKDDDHEPAGASLEALRPAHWETADQITVHTIESGLKRKDAAIFRDNYVKNLSQMPGWCVRAIEPS